MSSTSEGGPAAAATDTGSAWNHHDLSSPGVLLFRRLHFGVKAAVVSAVFVLVVLQLLVMLVRPAWQSLQVTANERVGVAAERVLITQALPAASALLVEAARSGRIDAAALAQVGAALAPSSAAAEGHFDPTDTFRYVRQAMEPLSQPVSDADDAFAKADVLLQQLLRAAGGVGALSALATDTDHVAHGLGEFATQDGLRMLAAVQRIAGLGAAAQASGEVSPRARRVVQGETYLLLGEVEQLFGYFEDLTKEQPELGQKLAYAEAFNAVNAFTRLTRRALPADGAGPGDGSALREAGATASRQLLALIGRSFDALDARLAERIVAQQRLLAWQGAFVAAGLLLAAYLFHCFYLVTRGGMQEIKRHIDAMAAGNLHTQPRPWGTDEAADVLHAVSAMQGSLRTLVGDVRSCAGDILTYSNQVSEGALDLSQRTELAAARVQESTASMDRIAQATRHTTQEVQRSVDLSRTGAHDAQGSRATFEHLAERIRELRGSSLRVGEIVGVIDSIAFQTNILALNAAVEAARAGEQGRGFAVVAAEVRSLAQRSATAAREIKSLVGESTEHSARGAEAVESAGGAVLSLVEHMQTISQTLERVAGTQGDQVRQVESVAASFSEVDHDAQRNAALVEQTSAAALSMREKAEQLAQAAARFSL